MKIGIMPLDRPLFKNKKVNLAVFSVLLVVLLMQLGLWTSAALRNGTYLTAERVWSSAWLHGSRGLPWQIARLRILNPTIPVWVEVEQGISMLLDPNDLVQHNIMATGVWESQTWSVISNHLARGGVFVDVGAHVGYHSLKAAKVVGPQGHVLAIEPNPDTLPILRENIAANHYTVITAEPIACSDTDTILELFSAAEKNSGSSSISKTNAGREGAIRASYRVRARPLDAIIQDSGVSRVDVLKIDVEGAEFLVLKGAQKTLERFHPVVIVELEEMQLTNTGTTVAAVTEWLRTRGYTGSATMSKENHNTEFIFTGRSSDFPE